MTLKPREYFKLALEAVTVFPLALDYKMKRKIEKDSETLLSEENLESTKTLAMTIKQQLTLDRQYNSFPWFNRDGILTRKAKEYVLNTADKLEEIKRAEVMDNYHKALDKGQATIDTKSYEKETDIIVIPPETILE